MHDFIHYYKSKGHVFGECMTSNNTNLMYVYIPKNASSWTKPNLKDLGWEFYNYHLDNLYHKHSVIVLRDPIDRWLSGIAEYFCLYNSDFDFTRSSQDFLNLIFDRVAFDDHTDKQILFLQNLNLDNATFFMCDNNYKHKFSKFLVSKGYQNNYFKYKNQYVTANDSKKNAIRNFFAEIVEQNLYYKNKLEEYFCEDYILINDSHLYE